MRCLIFNLITCIILMTSLITIQLYAKEELSFTASNQHVSEHDTLKLEEKPTQAVWELGIGVGALSLSHYIGSKEEERYISPLPYFLYNSAKLKADRKGVRGLIWQGDKTELNISSKISFAVDSDKNDARTGMPDLDFLLEIGPSFNYEFYISKEKNNSLSLEIPVRAATSFNNLDPQNQGWIANPSFEYRYNNSEWKVSMRLGPMIANEKYNRYFYEIQPQYENQTRSAYQAKSGLVAYRFSTSISRRFDSWYIGAFFNFYDLSDSSNSMSDLIQSEHNINAGFFVAKVLKQKF
jgi:MipA family protein